MTSGRIPAGAATSQPKRAKKRAASTEGGRSDTALATGDVAAITANVTRAVTQSVMDSLREAGVVPRGTSIAVNPGPSRLTQDPEQSQCTEFNVQSTSVDPSGPSVVVESSSIVSPSTDFLAEISAAKSGFVSSTLPMHFRVPLKTKEKIWAGDYVELSTLQQEESEDITISLKSGQVSANQSLKRKFLSIEAWTDAFSIYASVYRQKFPEQSEQLSSYMGTIRKIASEHGAWFYYDMNFRKLRRVANRGWDQIETELYLTALSRKQQPFRAGRDQSPSGWSRVDKSRPITGGHISCHKYNKGTECSGCNYPHVCRHCGGSHPLQNCWQARNKFQKYNAQCAPGTAQAASTVSAMPQSASHSQSSTSNPNSGRHSK